MSKRSALSILLVLALAGLLVSLYLVYHHTILTEGFQVGPSFCAVNPHFDCDRVALSPFSTLFGVPIASYGVFYYAILALILLASRFLPEERASVVILASCFSAVPPTVLLFGVSVALLGTICLMCVATYVVNILLAVIAARSFGPPTERRIIDGIKEALTFIAGALRLELPAIGAIALGFGVFLGTLRLPEAVGEYYVSEHPELRNPSERAVIQWEGSPQEKFDLEAEGSERNFSLGDSKAPISVVAFSDFQCPHCKVFAKEMHEFAAKYPTRFVAKNFPLDDACNPVVKKKFHLFGCTSALMARCAGEEGDENFWKMHDAIFALDEIDEQSLLALPAALGLDLGRFQACMNGGETRKGLERDIREGIRLNLGGTPAVYVNGRRVSSPKPEVMRRIFERISKSGK